MAKSSTHKHYDSEAGLEARVERRQAMAIVKVDPFREISAMQDRMARLFGDVYLRDEDTAFRGSWAPVVDIFETEQHDLVIKAEVPGMTREDIEVTVENSTLVLKGTKKFDADIKEENYRRIERTYGTFNRSFTLPNTVDATKVTADYKNGVLTVKLPFREEAKPRTINVDIA
jgi:HSP20 family protein